MSMSFEGNSINFISRPDREIPERFKQAVRQVLGSVNEEIGGTLSGYQRDIKVEKLMADRLRDNPDWEMVIGDRKYGGEEAYELFKHLRARDNL